MGVRNYLLALLFHIKHMKLTLDDSTIGMVDGSGRVKIELKLDNGKISCCKAKGWRWPQHSVTEDPGGIFGVSDPGDEARNRGGLRPHPSGVHAFPSRAPYIYHFKPCAAG